MKNKKGRQNISHTILHGDVKMRGPARLSTEAMSGVRAGEKERSRRWAERRGAGGGGGECRVGRRRSTGEGHVRSSVASLLRPTKQ